MRLNLVAAAYALWLLSTEALFYFSYAGGGEVTALQVSIALGIIPVAMQFLLLGVSPFGLVAPVRMALYFFLIVLASYWGNAHWTSVLWLSSLVVVVGVAILVAGSPDERLIRNIAVFFSIPAALFLLYCSATGEHVWGRLEAHGITPDWWGLMGAGLAMAGLAHRSRVLMVLCISIGIYITYDASARSNMLSILCGLLAVGSLELRALRGSRLVMTVATCAAVVVVWMVFSSTIDTALSKLVDDVMQVNNPTRGLGTGLTGRTTIWNEAFRIWLKWPVFGVGFHQLGMLMPGNIEAHQVYLAILAETGIAGLIWYTCFLGASLYGALHIDDPRTRNVAVGTIVAYAAIGFFDARGFSSGNPTSLYFEMCCFFALRCASIHRVARSKSSGLPEQSKSSLSDEAGRGFVLGSFSRVSRD
jgi:O-antigen ligase